MLKNSTRPLKVIEAANALGLSVYTVRAWISQRRLAHLKLGRAIRILPAEVEKFLKNSTVLAKVEEVSANHSMMDKIDEPGRGE